MLNKTKRLISTFLCITLICALTAFPAFAADAAEFSASVTADVSPQGNAAEITFTEELKQNLSLSDVKLFEANGGNEVALNGIECDGTAVTLNFGSVLDALAEYVVILPENLESKSGAKISSPYIYFTTGENEPYDVTTPHHSNDFETNIEFANSSAADADMVKLSLVDSGDAGYGKVLQILNTGTGAGSPINNGSEKVVKLPTINVNSTAQTVTTSFDFKVSAQTYYGRVYLEFQNAYRAIVSFKSNGNLAIGNGWVGNASNDMGGAYNVGSWNNVKIVYNVPEKEILIYVNGVFKKSFECTGVMDGTLDIKFDSGTIDTNTHTTMWLDNFKTESAKSVTDAASLKVSKTRFVNRDGSEEGPLSQGAVLGNANKVKLYFSDVVDATQLTATLTDGVTPVPVSLGSFNSEDNSVTAEIGGLLVKDADYTFSVSGGGIDAYRTTFKTSDLGFVFADDAEFVADGSDVYLDTSVTNTTDGDAEVLVSLSAYKNFAMTDTVSYEYTIGTGETLDLTKNSEKALKVVADADTTLKALVLQKVASGYNVVSQTVRAGSDGEFAEGNKTFKYEGQACEADNDIAYTVTAKGESEVIYRDVIKSNSAKEYAVCFNINPDYKSGSYKSGMYDLTIYENNNAAVIYPVHYVDKDERSTALANINTYVQADNNTALATELEAHAYAVADSAAAEGIDYDDVADCLIAYTDNAMEESEALRIINKAAYANAASAGVLENVFDAAEQLEFDNSSIKDFYNKAYVDEAVQGYVTGRLKECDATRFGSFDDELTEAFILSVTQKPNGIANLKEVFNAFYTHIGIAQNAPDFRYKAVQNKSYATLLDLASAFNSAVNPSEEGYFSNSSTPSIGTTNIGTDYVENKKEPLVINIFSDVIDDYWGKDAIVKLAQQGIINGKGDGKFYPEHNITREEFVKIVIEALHFDITLNGNDFSDIDKNEWYYPYIASAVENGIITGYADGSFGIGENITRQDMCVILHRAAEKLNYTFYKTEGSVFSDIQTISDYARESVDVLSAEGIINGYDTGDFRPFANSTRAECATMIYNFMNLFNEI